MYEGERIKKKRKRRDRGREHGADFQKRVWSLRARFEEFQLEERRKNFLGTTKFVSCLDEAEGQRLFGKNGEKVEWLDFRSVFDQFSLFLLLSHSVSFSNIDKARRSLRKGIAAALGSTWCLADVWASSSISTIQICNAASDPDQLVTEGTRTITGST